MGKWSRGVAAVAVLTAAAVTVALGLGGGRPDTRPATAPATGPAMHPAVRRVRVFVSGRVQGVGFRDYTVAEARRIGGVTGYVLNLRDGRVEAVIEGPPDNVRQLLEAIRKGPPLSRVEKVEVTDEPYQGGFKTFIRTTPELLEWERQPGRQEGFRPPSAVTRPAGRPR